MYRRLAALGATSATVITLLSGCSTTSTPLAVTAPGALPPNTAKLILDGREIGISRDIDCTQVQWTWTVDVGDETSGSTAVIETGSGPLTARSVRFRNVDGFSGSYWDGNNGNARASVEGGIWTVAGTVDGFDVDTDGIDRTSRDFRIEANC